MSQPWENDPVAMPWESDPVAETEEDTPFSGLSASLQTLSGVSDLPVNLTKFLSSFDDDPEKQARLDDYVQRREQGIEDVAGDASDLWRLAGNVIGSGGAGGPVASTRKLGADALERVANVATESGLFGAMTEDPNIGQDVAAGAAISAPIEAISALAGKAKRIPGAVGRLFPMSDAAKEADQFAKSRNVPVAGEDLVQNTIVRSTGRALDAADPTNFRNKQLAKMQDAFRREIVDPYTEFDQPLDEMSQSFRREYKAVNKKKGELYKKAYREMNPLGPVPMDNFRAGLQDLKKETARVLGPNDSGVGAIDQWLKFGDANIEDWATRRKKLGRQIRKATRSADPDTVDAEVLGSIRGLLDESIDGFGGQSNAYREANDFFKQQVMPYREDAFMKNIKKGKVEKVVNDALSGAPTAQTEERFKQAWGSLDPAGRRAYRQRLLEQIMEASTNAETGFSPDRAATMMDRLKNRLGDKVLGPELSRAMDGWNNLFRESGFAAENVARSRTGASVAQIAAPVAVLSGVVAPSSLIALAPPLLIRSRKFRQMLGKLAEMNPKHPDYRTVTNDVMSELTREAARVQALGSNE